MKIGGTYKIAAPIQQVWDGLMDTATLQNAFPGADRLDETASGEFEAEITVGLGAIRGKFHGRILLSEPNSPSSLRLQMDGEGPGGWIKGEGFIALCDSGGGTKVEVDGEAQTGGVLARVGQRMIGNGARTLMAQFFKNLEREVTR